jgi:dTDP-4-amino-4,6-dideoxygalactose transaminase
MSLHGLSCDAYKRYSTKVFRHYRAIVPGYKYNMMDLQAAIGIHQLARIERNAKLRKRYWEKYERAFKRMLELITPAPEGPNTYHARHLYAILVRPEKLRIDRDYFIRELIKMNIGSGVHFYPVHLHPYYRKSYGYKKGDFPNAEFVGDRILSLPLGANLTVGDVNYVIDSVRQIVGNFRL